MKRLAMAAALAFVGARLDAAPLGDWTQTFVSPSGDVQSVAISRSGDALVVKATTKHWPEPLRWSSVYANGFSKWPPGGAGASTEYEAVVAEFARADGTRLTMILDDYQAGAIRVQTYVRPGGESDRYDYITYDRLAKSGAASVQRTAQMRLPMPLPAWQGDFSSAGDLEWVSIRPDAEGSALLTWSPRCTPPCAPISAQGVPYAPAQDLRPTELAHSLLATAIAASGRQILHLASSSSTSLEADLYIDSASSGDYVLRARLDRRAEPRPPTPAPSGGAKSVGELCLSFLPGDVVISGWPWTSRQLTYQGKALTGPASAADARTARAIIQHYRMNKRCEVGGAINYWLVDGRPPAGAYYGEDCVDIDPSRLSIRPDPPAPYTKRWVIVSGDAHFAFAAPTAAKAEEAAAAIRSYGFVKSCFVGRPAPSMSYLRK